MFGRRIKLFTLLGFTVYVDWSWFILFVLISWSLGNVFPVWYEEIDAATATPWLMGVAGALGLFVSIVAHELGHSVVARQFGVPIEGITLFLFGGVAEMRREPPSAKAEFFVAIAGPIVSVVISGVAYALAWYGKGAWPIPAVGVLRYLGLINAVLVGFNLIPAFPLDGGRVLRSILWHTKGNLRWATRVTSSIGSAFGLGLILLGAVSFIGGNFIGGMWQFLIGMFLRNAAQMSYQQVLIRRALEGEPVTRFMRSEVVTVPEAITIDQLVEDYIYRHHHKMYPVTRDGQLVGCVTTRAVQSVPREQWNSRVVRDLVEPCEAKNTVTPETDAMAVLSKMHRVGASRLMVVENGQLKGIISLKDLMRFISLKVELEDNERNARDLKLPAE